MTIADHLDDEQLTALQDGDGSAAERAHLAGCDRCRARSDALTGVAELVAAPPPEPSAAARDAAVAAALRETDRPVAPRHHRPRRAVPSWLAPVAAVAVLLALIAAVVPRLGSGDGDDDSAAGRTSASESSDEAGGAGGGAAASEEDRALQRGAAPAAADLGAVDDEATLARRVGDALAAEAASDAPLRDEDPCAASFRSLAPPLGPLRLRASVVWRGEPAEVVSDGNRAVVLANGSCAPLATVDVA